MAALPPVDPSHHGVMESQSYNHSREKLDERGHLGSTWYFSRREIEESSPSRRDGIDLKKEAYLRKSYCTFLQDLGMRLKVPQVTIATAIIFCHRFFLRQSHVKNDRRTVATVCMFLAGKVEETPRPLKDVIIVSYEIIHKKDLVAVQRIKQREVYEQQKELILLGERVVLATLGFDLNVHHPYKPLVEAIKKFKVAQNALAQVAWNFVNDGLRTSLCLQFKPHHIAAGAIFLAAKFLKVKLPSDGEKVWWQEFDVTPRQLEEVSNQMLELYEQNRATAASNGIEAEGNSAGGSSQRIAASTQASVQESTAENGQLQAAVTLASKHGNPSTSFRHVVDQSYAEQQCVSHKIGQNESSDHGEEPRSKVWDNCADAVRDNVHHESGKIVDVLNGKTSYRPEKCVEDPARLEPGGKGDGKDCSSGLHTEGHKVYSPIDAIKKIDKDKVKAALEKRRKSRGDLSKKIDVMNEDDLIERELESGVELAVEDERTRKERRHSLSSTSHNQEHQYPENRMRDTRSESKEATEEGELSLDSRDFPSSEAGSRKRKVRTPDRQMEGKEGFNLPHRLPSSYSKHQERLEDGIGIERHDSQERDDRKHG